MRIITLLSGIAAEVSVAARGALRRAVGRRLMRAGLDYLRDAVDAFGDQRKPWLRATFATVSPSEFAMAISRFPADFYTARDLALFAEIGEVTKAAHSEPSN